LLKNHDVVSKLFAKVRPYLRCIRYFVVR